MPELRVFDRIARPMQRLGYLKRLVRRVVSSTSSNLENLGNDLVETISRKTRIALDEERVKYIKGRLFDRAYTSLKQQANAWLETGGEPPQIMMELQDLYLADPSLPSQVGKLVREDWRKYPFWGINLGLVRAGTYSANTRGLTLMHLTSEDEQKAFQEYLPEHNPLRISRAQGLLFLYAMIENDGEVLAPMWCGLPQDGTVFNDRDAGDLLPEIYRSVIARYRKRSLSIDMRERLDVLEQSAESIARQRNAKQYTGGSAREEASRLRIEPGADIGLFNKPTPARYEYTFSLPGRVWVSALAGVEDSAAVELFLSGRFFTTAAAAWEITAQPADAEQEMIPALYHAWKAIASSSGYAPIEELALLAGITSLLEKGLLMEHTVARQALIDFQKANPYTMRFTVDRLGKLAHVRFMEDLGKG